MPIAFLSTPLAGMAAAILVVMAVIHMYWALGGSIGVEALVPQTAKGPLFRVSASMTLIVALVFILAADLMFTRLGMAATRIPPESVQVACITMAAAFLIRAVGDFRYVGFFKRVRGSRFAQLDTTLYSPVSLFLSVAIGVNSL
ncbi:MAG TPA: DUF3995 domain-containing protein [Magnetospirillaceae bacterium]